ncbi:LysR family transcriptional regulator [Polymorphobacter multimanifer]|uniref:DNA-binding transcriptional LysR family regulator n=1 Tax=Polymorphobacter multimanifer TaxID=1070431 RepID=A0A841L3U7_9SPHN|nr:LysR family transcriptional regulator [Polymorphobacter multimanifer]MBB6227519.1 DNA-binding transcriptional LysR family regulator [Polymorphobacter multimanifer]GGI84574.1 LysR family transcriptional regulator [Polymorphobacter multimanifer]
MKNSYTIPRHLLDGIEAFLRVAERRSFRAAAEDMGVSPSAISQTVRALEERMGVALLTRTTRSVGVTEAGARLLADAAPAFAGLVAAWDSARTLGDRPAGLLRINMPRAVVPILIEPIIASFCDQYPDVDVEIAAEDGLVDLAASGFDAGIRIGEMLEADMIAVRLSDAFRYIVVGSPGYIQRCGRPLAAADLKQHDCIRMRFQSGIIAPWRFAEAGRGFDVTVKGRIISNDMRTTIAMALRGLGLAYVSEPLVEEEIEQGLLEPVLGHLAVSSPGLFLFYPGRAQVLPKLRAFIDHVKAHMLAGTFPALPHG